MEDGVLMCACTGPDPEQAARNIVEAMEERFGVSPTLAMIHRANIEAAERRESVLIQAHNANNERQL